MSHLVLVATPLVKVFYVYLRKLREQSQCGSVNLLFNAVVLVAASIWGSSSDNFFGKIFFSCLFSGNLMCAQKLTIAYKT